MRKGMYLRMEFKVSSVKQPETTNKDILKMWFDIKNSIGLLCISSKSEKCKDVDSGSQR